MPDFLCASGSLKPAIFWLAPLAKCSVAYRGTGERAWGDENTTQFVPFPRWDSSASRIPGLARTRDTDYNLSPPDHRSSQIKVVTRREFQDGESEKAERRSDLTMRILASALPGAAPAGAPNLMCLGKPPCAVCEELVTPSYSKPSAGFIGGCSLRETSEGPSTPMARRIWALPALPRDMLRPKLGDFFHS